MKYCTYCGNELHDEAVVCPSCGCPVEGSIKTPASDKLLRELSGKVKTNGVIWICIAGVQILLGIFALWYLLIVGVLNLISGISSISYSSEVLKRPCGIVKKFEPLAGPIVVLIYNLIFGGVIGVVGSVYYLVAIRNFVVVNREAFDSYENKYSVENL